MNFLSKYIFITFVSGLISAITVPLVIKFGNKYRIVDIPNGRKKHSIPIVRIGGLAILASIISSIVPAYFFDWIEPSSVQFIRLLFISSLSMFMLGFSDDILTISPLLRLTFQIIISIFVWNQGIRIDILDFTWINEDFYFLLPKILSLIVTVFWISAITNAFNWLDGLDGLAAGTCVVSAFGFSLIIFSTNHVSDSYIMGALIGGSIGFLIYNFYKAKIYMGDCGSYFIGFSLALTSMLPVQ